MNKKGEGGFDTKIVLWVFYIILVIIITYFLYTFIDDAASGEEFHKKYFINDLGLSMDALHSANHDLEIKYKNLKDYNLKIFNGEIKLADELSRYRYAVDKNQEIAGEFTLKENQTLIINKKGNIISFNIKNGN